jgi:PhnB protein
MKIPEGLQAVMPYLILHNAAGFIDFTRSVFGAVEIIRHVVEGGNGIMHAQVKIVDSTIMFADATDKWPVQTANMFVYVDDCDETYRKAIDNNAETIMQPGDQPYGRSCGVKDAYGNTWWITAAP